MDAAHFIDIDNTRYIRIMETPASPGWWDVEVVAMGGDHLIGSGKGLDQAKEMAAEWIAAFPNKYK